MKQNKYIVWMIFLFMGILSCNEDFLDLKDPNALSDDIFWRNLEDADKGLTATYGALLNHYIYGLDIEGFRTDQGWPGWGRPSGNPEVSMWYFLSYSGSDSRLADKWDGCYAVIFRANQVIEGLEEIKADQVTEDQILKWTHMMGQVRFIRGLMHFYLYSTFNKGSIIIRDFVPSTSNDFNKGLSPANEVFSFFVEDLKYAYDNLPAKYLYENETSVAAQNIGRITRGTAATILGTCYLYNATDAINGVTNPNSINEALNYFDDVINNSEYGYALETNLQKLFTVEGEFNSESIFELSYNLEFNTELNQWDEKSLHNRWAKQMYGSTAPLLPAWAIYAYKTEPMDTLFSDNYYEDSTSPSGFSMRNVPLRCSRYATVVEDEQTLYQLDYNIFEKEGFAWDGWGFGRCSKYAAVHEPALETDWKSNKNVVLNRLSGVYLMQAECLTIVGRTTEAIDLINKIRARWGLVLLGPGNGDTQHTYDGYNYASDPDSLMKRIMYIESPLELFHEGHATRWINMRRWGIAAERFKELSNQTYYAVSYTGTKYSDGDELVIQYSSIVREGDPTYDSDPDNHKVIDYEYNLTSINYNPEIHDWFPIPIAEGAANSEID